MTNTKQTDQWTREQRIQKLREWYEEEYSDYDGSETEEYENIEDIRFIYPEQQYHHVCLTCFIQFRTYSNLQTHIFQTHSKKQFKRLRMF